MKKCIIGLVAILGLTGCNTLSNVPTPSELTEQNAIDTTGDSKSKGSLDINPTEVFEYVQELATYTPTVIIGQVENNSEEFEYKGVTFYKSQVKIKDIFRDNEQVLSKNGKVTLLQNDIGDIDPLVKKNEKVLLFLKKYEGPVIEDAYRLVGLYQGQYKVGKDGTIAPVGGKYSNKIKGINELNLDNLDTILKESPYVQLKRDPMTKEEIKEQNAKERKFEEEHQKNNN
jgi:YHS domain-containing protein